MGGGMVFMEKWRNNMGKYIHKFDTVAEFETAYNGTGYTEPWVSLTVANGAVNYNKPNPFNGHDYVDFGLPSGTIWAAKNVGATDLTDTGPCFAWGETDTKSRYTWETYKWGTMGNLSKYNATDGLTVLDLEDDAAHVNMGGAWHMPTSGQVLELRENTNWSVEGNKVICMSLDGTKALFIPVGNAIVSDTGQGANGLIWTSLVNLSKDSTYNYAWGSQAYSTPSPKFSMWSSTYRYWGFPVRGVIG